MKAPIRERIEIGMAEARHMGLMRLMAHVEYWLIKIALRRTRGNKAAAARLLGLKRTTLAAKCRKYEITDPKEH